MPKILGNSSGKNNKSCSVFYQESKKIGFVFFLFFLRFYMDFTRISKAHILFEMRFCTGVPGIFQLSQIHPWFKKITLERAGCLQCSPWGWGAARLAEIWRLRRRPWPGKWRERVWGSPRFDLWPEKEAGRLGWAWPAGTGRLRPRRLPDRRARRQATAVDNPGECTSVWGRAKEVCPAWGAGGRRARRECANGGAAAPEVGGRVDARGSRRPFYSPGDAGEW
jgi:hypothetical protein